MSLLSLPEEVILHIARYLPPADILYFSTVTKATRRICHPLYASLTLLLPNPRVGCCGKTWKSWGVATISLDCSDLDFVTQQMSYISSLLSECFEIEVLNGRAGWESVLLESIKVAEPSLNLNIKRSVCDLCKYSDEYKNLRSHINFIQCHIQYHIQSRGFEKCLHVAQLCGSKTIGLINCVNKAEKDVKINDELVGAILCSQHLSCKETLRSVALDGSQITQDTVLMLSNNFPNITSLSLAGCQNIPAAVLNTVGQMSNLSALCLAGSREITGLSGLADLTTLTSLDVSNCTQLKDISGIVDLLGNLVTLKLAGIPGSLEILALFYLNKLNHLDIRNCYQVSDSLISRLKLPNLMSLDISSCVRVTEEMLRAVVCRSERLVTLNLSWLKKISVKFFRETLAVSEIFWRMESLTLSNMNIDDETLSLIQSAGPVALKKLQLSMCKGVTDRGVARIAMIPTIQELDISHLRLITDTSIGIISCKLYRLRTLKVTGCMSLTDRSITALKRCSRLASLDCTQCSLLTFPAVSDLQDHLPKLKDVLFVRKLPV